jgi:ABC-type multidrug transport system ATPase subunit
VTVFVTTHFMEEADYCDWVSLIDAGRLIADATPEDLRKRYSSGYRIAIALPEGSREAAVRDLGRGARASGDGVELTVAELDESLLGALRELTASHAGARLRIDQPRMTDVFRQVLTETQKAAA